MAIITIRQSLLLAAKDTKIFFKDRFAVAFAFLFPFLFIIGFSLALGGQGPSDEVLEFTLASRETEGFSNLLLDAVSTESDLNVNVMEHDDALAAAEKGEIAGFIAFPADFSQSLMEGRATSLKVILADGSQYEEGALIAFARSLTGNFLETQVVAGAIDALAPADAADSPGFALEFEDMFQDRPAEIGFEVETVGDIEPYNASNFTLPGYLTMFVFFAAAMSAEAIARERRDHTLERLMSNGTRRDSIILGKFLGTLLIGLMQIAVLWVVGVSAFGIDLGVSPAAVVSISILMVLASSAFGVLLASLVSDMRAASTAGVLSSLVLAPLGGCWWPLFITPQWMQSLAKITPHGWANTGFNKLMLFGAEFGDVTQEMMALVVFALLFLAVAMWRFRMSAV